jgi:hypothetical protein
MSCFARSRWPSRALVSVVAPYGPPSDLSIAREATEPGAGHGGPCSPVAAYW